MTVDRSNHGYIFCAHMRPFYDIEDGSKYCPENKGSDTSAFFQMINGVLKKSVLRFQVWRVKDRSPQGHFGYNRLQTKVSSVEIGTGQPLSLWFFDIS
jgi:hypothetical protein